ncbi:MAG: hydrogenase expression/formation protein HypE [Bacteroidales bacterium]|nr:hydrogenase expression/formation protein HypE [Bacteroidales bacterium]
MNNTILLGHGSGGIMTGNLIRNLFLKYFNNPLLEKLSDSSVFSVDGATLAFTTDSYVVDPIFFPGGDIGKLAVCGTVNDLAMSGAKPLYLSSGLILEEGFPLADLETIVSSMSEEAQKAGIQIITGDTKVVKKGQCDKVFINTAGIGILEDRYRHISGGLHIRPGDQLIVNGFLGDHEIAIMAARENLKFEEPVASDVASLHPIVHALLEGGVDIHFMRDLTRGGIASVLDEMAENRDFGVSVSEASLPIRDQTQGLCELYGFDPLYLANEGKMVLVVARESAGPAIEIMHGFETGTHAALIGVITSSKPGMVLLQSRTGGTRIVTRLAGEQLPRIC